MTLLSITSSIVMGAIVFGAWIGIHFIFQLVFIAKVIGITRSPKCKVESIELDNEQKMTFKEYSKISQF